MSEVEFNIDRLKQLAASAIDGPWFSDGAFVGTMPNSHDIISGVGYQHSDEKQRATADFIAEANPATVLKLIAISDQLRQQLEAAQAEVKRLESAWHAGDLNRKDEIIARQEAENDRLKAIIKKAQGQEHIGVIDHSDDDVTGGEYFVDFAPDTDLVLGGKVYALPPIPAEHGEDWKPIETAPKTGRKLLLSLLNVAGKRRTIVGFWVERFTMEDDGDSDESDVDEKDGTYYWREGWYESLESHDDFSCLYAAQDSITHFMPLPSAP